MESALIRIYETFEDTFGREKARAFAENLVELIQKKNDGLATRENLSETELRIRKEIEEIKKEIEEIKKEVEGIKKEIEGIKKETEGIKKEIVEIKINAKDVELRLTREINRAKIWTITAIGLIIGLLKGLDYILK